MPIFPSNKNDESDVLNICYKNDSADLQSDLEKSNPQIETNLDQPQLIFFRSYDEDKQSCLSLCSDEKIIWIKIPKKYLNFNLYISVILPDEDKKHDLLKLVSLHTYPIHHGEIVLKITEENLTNLRLDFFGIQFIDDQLINTDIQNGDKRNTARLFFKIFDNDEKVITSIKREIIFKENPPHITRESIGTRKDPPHITRESIGTRKGLCLVINDSDLLVLDSKDNNEIKKVFTEILNYDFKQLNVKKTQELKEMIKTTLNNFTNCHDQIVVFVLIYGDNNIFQTDDGFITFIDFMKLFLPKKCLQISEKPKLFFVSCFQRENINKPLITTNNHIKHNKTLVSNDVIKKKGENIPKHSNILMVSSTVPKNSGFDSKNGTPYVQTLLKVIQEHSELEITETIKITKDRIKEKYEAVLTPYVYNCLHMKVYF